MLFEERFSKGQIFWESHETWKARVGQNFDQPKHFLTHAKHFVPELELVSTNSNLSVSILLFLPCLIWTSLVQISLLRNFIWFDFRDYLDERSPEKCMSHFDIPTYVLMILHIHIMQVFPGLKKSIS